MQNSQRQIYQQQIDLLKIQIDEQNKREQKLRQLIDTLTQQMQYQRQVQQQNFRLTQLNEKLLDGIKEAKIRHTEEIKYYDDEIYKLKQEIHQRINQNQRNRVQFQKRQLVFQEKKAMLQSIIEKKCHRVNQLQKKLHEESISKLKEKQKENSSVSQVLSYSRANQQSDKYLSQPQGSNQLGMSTLRISQIDNNFDSQNNMRASNISTISRKSKGGQYLLMNKSEMKVMMGALIKSKREMQKGGIKSSEVGQQRINKTMLN